MIKPDPEIKFSGERFQVHYKLSGFSEEDARNIAQFICIEDTIEYPYELVAPGDYHDQMVGHIEEFSRQDGGSYQVRISYAIETTGLELAQLLNVVYGNITFLPGIRVEELDLSPSLQAAFKGPRFGSEGIRKMAGISRRPLVSTALKPMGLSPVQLAEMAYQCALGGIDIIKDDHGLSDQPFSPFRERIPRVIEAIRKANQATGFTTLYFPSVIGRMEEFLEKAYFAKEQGANGIMLMPAFSGLDAVRMLAEDDRLELPVIFHPGFYGTYRRSPEFGLSPFVIHGQLPRLFGADISIFPHYGGRFSPPQEECREAVEGLRIDMGSIKPAMPSPAGGVSPEGVKEITDFYGTDVICLAASNLHRLGPDLVENSKVFRKKAEEAIG